MDITKWLADTAIAVEHVGITDHPAYPAETSRPRGKPVFELPSSKRRTRKCKDPLSDSSILALDTFTEEPARRVVRQTHHDSDDSSLSEVSSHSSQPNAGEDKGDNPYQRRKRHKTKADRYDLKPQKQATGQQDGGKQKRKSTRKDKGAKRSKKDKSVPSVVRNYHAENVPRERLTVCMQWRKGSDTTDKSSYSHDQVSGFSREEKRHLPFEAEDVSCTLGSSCQPLARNHLMAV
jgi:hypothetical protein